MLPIMLRLCSLSTTSETNTLLDRHLGDALNQVIYRSIIFCLLLLSFNAHSQAITSSDKTSPAISTPVQGEQRRTLEFSKMGQPNGIRLTGVNRFVEMNSGVRLDELVLGARLSLKVLYPPGMRHDQSFIRVYVNDQLAAIS